MLLAFGWIEQIVFDLCLRLWDGPACGLYYGMNRLLLERRVCEVGIGINQNLKNMKMTFTGFVSKAVAATALALAMSVSAYADMMYVSYGVKNNDPVYPYTGFSTNENVDDMSVAVLLTKDMLAPYAGASLKAVYVGWAGVHQGYTPAAKVFLRHSLNDSDVKSAEVEFTAADGMNRVEFDEPYVIGADDEIYMGYTVDMVSGVYGPCTLVWGSFPEATHFVSRPDIKGDDGNPEWLDLATPGMMDMACPLILVAEVEVGAEDFDDKMAINRAALPSIYPAGADVTGCVSVSNTGSNDISSITVNYLGADGKDWSMDVELSKPIAQNSSMTVAVPVHVDVTGETVMTISKVNGNPNKEKCEWKFNAVAVPEDVAKGYTRRPLVEYFASESEYRSADYESKIVGPALEKFAGKVTRVNWHVDDQFQLGLADDKDEALDFAVEIAKGDKSLIYLPNIMVDRDMNLVDANYAISTIKSPLIGVLYSPFAEASYDYALTQPTFASIEVAARSEGNEIKVDVKGMADMSVLPEGEKLMLTVLLLEDGVESDSQEYPGGDGGSNPGYVVHNRMVRRCLTDIWGDEVKIDGGSFSASFTAEPDYDNNVGNMVAVAFLNRSKENGMWERSVINSAESAMDTSGVESVIADEDSLRPVMVGGQPVAPAGAVMQVFTADGKVMPSGNLPAGMYIVNVRGADGASASFKIIVK